MPKIALIGAGSIVFTRNLCSDILLAPSLQSSTLTLMDINADRLQHAQSLVEAIILRRNLPTRLECTLDLKEAVRDADYVITTFQQGGLEAYALDIEIPQHYGVEQCVGDTIGPGGVFRALRTLPVLVEICRAMNQLAPNALLLNYVNPMAAICWAVNIMTARPAVGLCHSIQETSALLAGWVNLPLDEITFLCAGINHFAFFLEFRHGRQDLYPRLRQMLERPEILAREPVRAELMRHFGYFCTESSGHNGEYVPYFRKSAQMVNQDLVPRFQDPANDWFDYARTGGYLRHSIERERRAAQEYTELVDGAVELPTARSLEYGASVIEAMETNQAIAIYGNVINSALIPNLPQGCCVEVPCLVDGNGIHPTVVGNLPPALAALIRTNVNVQELIVQAALTGSRDAVYHAVMLDPLTAPFVLSQIRAMVDELFTAQAQWLPQFRDG